VGASTAPEKPHGVSIDAASTLDFDAELDRRDGRQLRVRLVTFEPDGAVPLHSHNGRPGIAHAFQGTLTEHVEGKGVFERNQGDRLMEGRNTVYRAENLSDETVIVLATDVYKS
jgi:quercetin dioxygenase-like cupin family protein